MLAEKFFLVLETLRSHLPDDRPEIVTSPPPEASTPTDSHPKKPVPDGQEQKYRSSGGTTAPGVSDL